MKRRSFLSSSGALFYVPSALASAEGSESKQKRKKIAFLGTEVREHSHSQHFLDRLALGYGWKGKWQNPRLDIASAPKFLIAPKPYKIVFFEVLKSYKIGTPSSLK